MQEVKSLDKIKTSWLKLADLYPSENKIGFFELRDLYDLDLGFKRFTIGQHSTWYQRGFAFTYSKDLMVSAVWFEKVDGRSDMLRVNCGSDYAIIALDELMSPLMEQTPDVIIENLRAENAELRAQINKIREVLEIE